MELYKEKGKSIPQKAIIITLELVLLWLAYGILFQYNGNFITDWLGLNNSSVPMERRIIILVFSVIVFIRFSFMMIYLLKRKIPWEESISVPSAFALYYIGFALFALTNHEPIGIPDYIGILLFILGSFLNTYSELQRHFWKEKIENKGKLYTAGLFSYSMHINYFGDLLWVTAYAILTRNSYAFLIPGFLFCFFAFYNIPALDSYLQSSYGVQFEDYRRKTKKLIPFVY